MNNISSIIVADSMADRTEALPLGGVYIPTLNGSVFDDTMTVGVNLTDTSLGDGLVAPLLTDLGIDFGAVCADEDDADDDGETIAVFPLWPLLDEAIQAGSIRPIEIGGSIIWGQCAVVAAETSNRGEAPLFAWSGERRYAIITGWDDDHSWVPLARRRTYKLRHMTMSEDWWPR